MSLSVKIANALRHSFILLTTGQEPVAPEDREEMEVWYRRYSAEMRRTTALTTSAVTLFGCVAMAALAPEAIKTICVTVFALQAFNHLTYLTLLRLGIIRDENWVNLTYAIATQTVNIFGFGGMVAVAAVAPELGISHRVIGIALYTVISIMICDINKFVYGVGILGATLHVLGAAYIWRLLGYDHLTAWIAVVAGFDIYLYGYNFKRLRDLRIQAISGLSAHRLELQNEKLRLAAMESELQLARDLQESLSPPPEALKIGGSVIDFYHVPYGILGGDWFAVRELNNGSIVVAVADVTGKGVPAAMVVQALQSLWAHSLGDEQFQPELWIESVNRTLLIMGRKRWHTTTLGIMVLHADRLTYYSAGHVPLYLIRDTSDERSLETIAGSGNILGFAGKAQIIPVCVQLPAGSDYAVMMGTDGVFDWSMRKHRRQLFKFLTELNRRGAAAVADLESADDKILIHVRRSA